MSSLLFYLSRFLLTMLRLGCDRRCWLVLFSSSYFLRSSLKSNTLSLAFRERDLESASGMSSIMGLLSINIT